MRDTRTARGFRSGLITALACTLLLGATPGDSPVADAAMKGDIEAVRTLLKQGADVNAAQGDGMTALHWAAQRGDVPLAKILIYAGGNIRATTRLGAYSPLLLASRAGHAAMIRTLVDAGADPDARSANGAAALHFAAASGHVDAVTALLDRGADANARETSAGQTPLMFAAAYDRADVIRVLVQRGADASLESNVVDVKTLADADAVDRRRRNQVLAAARTETAGGGRGQGGDPAAELQGQQEESGGRGQAQRATAQQGRQAAGNEGRRGGGAQQAAQTEQRADGGRGGAGGRAGRSTADASADELAGNDANGQPPAADPSLPRAMSYNELVGAWGGMTPLLHAARQGHVHAVEALVESGVDVNQVSGADGTSPLLIATINGHFDLAMYLLEHGADPNLASEAGVAPLYGAVNVTWAPHAFYPQPSAAQEKTTLPRFVEALLVAGADPDRRVTRKVWYTGYNFDQSGVDETGATAFWRAAQASDVETMRILVKHGATPDVWSMVLPDRRAPNGRNSGEDLDKAPPVPVGGPAVSPLHVASGAGFDGNFHRNAPAGWLPAVRYLVDELGFDVNLPDYKGYTPLHNAAFRGDNEMIRYLVEKGADPTAVARNGQTTVDMANGPIQRLQPFPETIALLESLGAKNNHKCVSC